VKRAVYVTLSVLALVVVIVGAAFAFGTPQAYPPPAVVSTPSPAGAGDGVDAPPPGPPSDTAGSDGGEAPFGGETVEGEVPAPDPDSPFTFQIPGCRCHSDDPAVVEEHADYRLNQCRGCHANSPLIPGRRQHHPGHGPAWPAVKYHSLGWRGAAARR
jgi:hypothetical protein